MALTHGVFLHGNPMLNESDCRPGSTENIAPFGICRSSKSHAQQIDIHEANREELVLTDILPDGTWIVPDLPLEGRICIPRLGNKWIDAHEGVLVGDKPTLTTGCTLCCALGGIITFLTHGQEED